MPPHSSDHHPLAKEANVNITDFFEPVILNEIPMFIAAMTATIKYNFCFHDFKFII